jgi:ABC-type glycerol-3-phosphate transport system substrate-binding protein
MRTRLILLAVSLLLAACSALPTSSAAAEDSDALQSQYVGPGSTGDQRP